VTRRRKIIAVTSGVLTVYIIGVYFILSAILTRIMPEKISEQLERQVSIEHIRVNPLTLSVLIRGFEVMAKNGKGSFIRFESLYINTEILSLVKRGFIIKRLQLEQPVLKIERLSDTTFNFSDLLSRGTNDSKDADDPRKKPKKPINFSVADISIVDGSVIYNDVPLSKNHTIAPINWKLPFISNFSKHQDRFSEPALTFSVDDASVSADVQSKLFKNTMETIVKLSIKGVSLPHYTAYVPSDLINFKVEQGTLDITTEVSFRKEKGSIIVIGKGELTLSDLNVKDIAGNEIVVLPKLRVPLLPSVITENSLHFGEIQMQQPVVSALRKADGTINLSSLISTAEKQEVQAEGETKTLDKVFRVDVDRFLLTGGTARFNDFAVKKKFEDTKNVESAINDIDITLESFSTASGKQTKFKVNTNINNSAPFEMKGEMTVSPLTVESDISLSTVALSWCQPYLPENVKLVITGGLAEASAHISLSKKEDQKISAKVTGNTAIRKFASVDPEKAESFLGWTDFTIDGVDVSVWPLRISVDNIAFNGLNNQLVVFEDGASNLEKIFIKEKETAGVQKKTAKKTKPVEVTPIHIGKFSMKKSKFSFLDRSVKPNYSTYLFLKELSVMGLTSEDFKAADVTARGSIDGYAPVNITGAVNPLAKDLFVDLDFKVEHMEMVPFSTYTGKYIGRAIEKGEFNIDVKYHIKEKQIAADNHVLVDQFTLGKDVESPDAMNLPVGLAVSLLTDRKGIININLPISGRTDDPDFAWGTVVLEALGNLIMKAATSPFELVSSLVGGGEEMRYIEFLPGSVEIDEPEAKKLEAIRKLLIERPALKMEVVGYADTDNDRSALAELALERKIKAPALVNAAKNNQMPDAQTLASIVLTSEEREKMLRKLYKNEVLAKPVEGTLVKKLNDPSLTTGEMTKLLQERVTINDTDLQSLAMDRAGRVKKSLLQDETVSADRIFLKEPDNPFETEANGFKPSRVELGVN